MRIKIISNMIKLIGNYFESDKINFLTNSKLFKSYCKSTSNKCELICSKINECAKIFNRLESVLIVFF